MDTRLKGGGGGGDEKEGEEEEFKREVEEVEAILPAEWYWGF